MTASVWSHLMATAMAARGMAAAIFPTAGIMAGAVMNRLPAAADTRSIQQISCLPIGVNFQRKSKSIEIISEVSDFFNLFLIDFCNYHHTNMPGTLGEYVPGVLQS